MGLFERIFGRRAARNAAQRGQMYETLTAYTPAFRTWRGQMYEDALIRAVVDAKARHVSKLKVEFTGSAHGELKAATAIGPNEWQTWPQWLYRTSTILDVCNNACIVPVLDQYDRTSGFFTVLPQMCELISIEGQPYLRYTFSNGKRAAIEFSRCSILTRNQFKDDIFGEANSALDSTLSLLDMQKQGIEEGIRNGATFRFMARVSNFTSDSDLAEERKRFNAQNLQGESNGVLLFPYEYNDIKQIDSKPYMVDSEETKLIQTNVFNYFGVNEKILQSSAIGDELDGYYESIIEPFAVQLSDGLTRMVYTPREIGTGNRIAVTANRLQYMSTGNKISFARDMGDRGVLLIDEIRELFNYAPLPDGTGQHAPIRGEYYFTDEGKDNGKDENA